VAEWYLSHPDADIYEGAMNKFRATFFDFDKGKPIPPSAQPS
jgi:hypothetical protein